jgi:hypothetical protein
MFGEGTGELPLGGVPGSGEKPAAPAARGFYAQKQEAYCDVYSASLKTIKNWIAEGKESGKLPPLDSPADMPGWWTLVHPKRSVPARILGAAQEARLAAKKSAPPSGQPNTPPLPPSPPREPSTHAVGYAASLNRLRQAEADTFADFEAAQAIRNDEGNKDLAAIEQARRIWQETAEQLRTQEAQASKVLEKSGELLPSGEVRSQLMQLHGPIVSGLRSLYLRILTKAGNIPLAEAKQHFETEINRMLRELISSEFAPAADA